MTALLEIRGLRRDYARPSLFGKGERFAALKGVDLDVHAGEILGLVGESGSGKSTLARLAMALDRPDGGSVRFEGEDLFALTPARLRQRRRDFQMVFQDPFGSLDPRHGVGRIVAEPLHLLRPRLSKAQAQDRVAEMLAAVGLPPDAAARFPHEFSGGQRQRIALARALITRPKLVIADEPVSALDLSVQAQVLDLVLDLRGAFSTAFLFISHDLAVVESIADRVAVMRRGEIVETDETAAIFTRPRHDYTRRLLAANAAFDIPFRT